MKHKVLLTTIAVTAVMLLTSFRPFSLTLIKMDIGSWDMKTYPTKDVIHNLDFSNIVHVDATIRNDVGGLKSRIDWINGGTGITQGNVSSWDANRIYLNRLNNGSYDLPEYDDATINRGWLIITYEQ